MRIKQSISGVSYLLSNYHQLPLFHNFQVTGDRDSCLTRGPTSVGIIVFLLLFVFQLFFIL